MYCLIANVNNDTGTELDNWIVADIDKEGYPTNEGKTFNSLLKFILKRKKRVYSYGLDFLGKFITTRLLTLGYVFKPTFSKCGANEFSVTFSPKGNIYSISIKGEGGNCTIVDFLKVCKASFDELNEYIGDNDYEPVQLMAHTIQRFREQGINGITIAQSALSDCKKLYGGEDAFRAKYPDLSQNQKIDDDLRKSYHGGYCDVCAGREGKTYKHVSVWDVKSLYPSIMAKEFLPYGLPVRYEGEPPEGFPLWIGYVTLYAAVLDNGVPFLRINTDNTYDPRQYVSDTIQPVKLWLTSVDFVALVENYDVDVYSFNGGYAFRSTKGDFSEYIYKWFIRKDFAQDEVTRLSCKLMLNSLSGKFGANSKVLAAEPALDKKGKLKFTKYHEELRGGVYLPTASFITSYGRLHLTRLIRDNYERWLYSDTDSVHLIGEDDPNLCDFTIGSSIGELSLKYVADEARYLARKKYAHKIGDKTKVVCAGMPANIANAIPFNFFFPYWRNTDSEYKVIPGLEYWLPENVPGGIVRKAHVYVL